MSKEFSSLQKEILSLILKEKFVTCGEILAALWGWKGQDIGKAQYACRHASLSRVLTKLWMKDLIVIWKNLTRSRTAICLTPEGKTIALGILAETGKSRIRG